MTTIFIVYIFLIQARKKRYKTYLVHAYRKGEGHREEDDERNSQLMIFKHFSLFDDIRLVILQSTQHTTHTQTTLNDMCVLLLYFTFIPYTQHNARSC